MCGRYYITDEIRTELDQLVAELDKKINGVGFQRDVVPSDSAPVLFEEHRRLSMKSAAWGFTNLNSKQLIINARAETVKEKRMFSDCMKSRRCIVPAAGFYEWDSSRNKFTFERADGAVLFLAGIYQKWEGEDRFAILTTAANSSMEPVHHRMPLVLDGLQMKNWLFQNETVDELLKLVPMQLERNAEVEQLRLNLM